jgi:hypothetical protein
MGIYKGESVEMPEFVAVRRTRTRHADPAHCFVARPRWALSRTIPDLSIVAEAGWRRFSWAVGRGPHVGRAAVLDGRVSRRQAQSS